MKLHLLLYIEVNSPGTVVALSEAYTSAKQRTRNGHQAILNHLNGTREQKRGLGEVFFSNCICFTRHTGFRHYNIRKLNPGCRDSCSQTLKSRLPGCYPHASRTTSHNATISDNSTTELIIFYQSRLVISS